MCALPQGSARCDSLPTPMSGCHLHRARRGRPLGAVVWLAGCPPVSSRAAVPSSTVPGAGGTCPGIQQYPSLALPTCVQTACLLWGSRLEARGGRGHQKPTLISPPVSEVCQHEHSPFYAPSAIPAHQSAQGQSADSSVLSRGGRQAASWEGRPCPVALHAQLPGGTSEVVRPRALKSWGHVGHPLLPEREGGTCASGDSASGLCSGLQQSKRK